MLDCPLCSHQTEFYVEDRRRTYVRCPRCDLISADPDSHLNAAAERTYYDLHENDSSDPGYRGFLGRLSTPLLSRLTAGMRGLDYGCGPGPTLSIMLTESGMLMKDYDPIYRPNSGLLECSYDFLTCTEVVEHFRQPSEDWHRLISLLKPGGWLGVMTKLVISRERFATWHYKDDPTHLSFYSQATFVWLGARFDLAVEQVERDVILLQKC